MSTHTKPALLRNPADFQLQYLAIQLKLLHKQKSFTTTRRNFYTLVLVTRGAIRETIGQ